MEHHTAFVRGFSTEAHRKLCQGVVDAAKAAKAQHSIVFSKTVGPKDPLTPEQKIKHARRALSKGANLSSATSERPSLFHHAAALHASGVRHLVIHGGSDRREMADKIKEYNGKEGPHGYYKFDSISFRQHGGDRKDAGKAELDPNDESTYSGSNARKAVKAGDRATFHRIAPSTLSPEHKDELYNDTDAGLRANTKKLKEDVTREDFGPMLKSFVSFASDKLGIKSLPNVRFKKDSDEYNSFAAYNPASNEVSVQTKGRHPMDVCRSVAHELVHHWQNENGKIGKNIAKEGSTGSPQENEANAVAGKIMRWFAQTNPDAFAMSHIVEQKSAIFVVGGPCSGKDKIVKHLVEAYALKELDVMQVSNELPDNIVVNGSAHDLTSIASANERLRELNYTTSMIFVDVNNNISKMRNEQRAAKGQRVISEGVRYSKFSAALQNKTTFKNMFGDNMLVIDNSLTEAVKEPTGDLKKACWKGYTAVGTKKKNGKTVPNCVPKTAVDEDFEKFMEDSGNREWGTKSLTNIYKTMTPGQAEVSQPKKKWKKKKLNQEGILDNAAGTVGLSVNGDAVGPEFAISKVPGLTTGYAGLTESVIEWMNNPVTQSRFIAKYGDSADKKLFEAAKTISETFTHETKTEKKTFYALREAWDARGGRDKGTVPSSGSDDAALEEGSWSDKKYQNPKGGLTKAGVMKYRSENPGSKLQTAVRTPPSKLKKGSKAANRRKSFCSRMKGMKKKLTSAKTARDPDSRINKSLRAWNCEE